MRRLVITLWVLAFFAAPTHAERYVESFTDGSNVGQWYYGGVYPGGPENILPEGGNPGAYLAAIDIRTDAPWPMTRGHESVFVGNYRDRGVERVGIDLVVNSMDTPEERRCSVVLYTDNNTPADESDDWVAYKYFSWAPAPGNGWRSMECEIPSQSETWPDDWSFAYLGLNAPVGDWTKVITDVDALGFYLGYFEFMYFPQDWTLGIDNPWIEWDQSAQTTKSSFAEVKLLFLN